MGDAIKIPGKTAEKTLIKCFGRLEKKRVNERQSCSFLIMKLIINNYDEPHEADWKT